MNGENTVGPSIGGLQTPTPEVSGKSKQGQIDRQFNFLSDTIDRLGKTISILEDKLNPILGESLPQKESQDKEAGNSVLLAEVIRTQKLRVSSLNRQLRNILERIEL